uniref:Uncharacterized protein n=1 Tax=Arundo donax TaxID=35708 RepID=A0A0A9G1G0_ARUDO
MELRVICPPFARNLCLGGFRPAYYSCNRIDQVQASNHKPGCNEKAGCVFSSAWGTAVNRY